MFLCKTTYIALEKGLPVMAFVHRSEGGFIVQRYKGIHEVLLRYLIDGTKVIIHQTFHICPERMPSQQYIGVQ